MSLGLSKDVPVNGCRPVVFLGEGNFSFTHAVMGVSANLLQHYFGFVPTHMLASSFDDAAELIEKYPELKPMLARLQEHPAVRVLHGVNAVRLDEDSVLDAAYRELVVESGAPRSVGAGALFDAICWNHPHLGTEDCKMHHSLLHHFLFSAISRLKQDGCIIVALVEGQGERWEIETVAAKFDFFLESCTFFDTSAFPGYGCKRNTTGKSFKNGNTKRQWVPGKTQAAASTEMISFVYRFRHTRHRSANLDYLDERKVEQGGTHIPHEFVQQNQTVPASAADALKDIGPASADDALCFRCEKCDKSYRSRQGLQTHVRQVHELQLYKKNQSAVKLHCRFCSREYTDKAALWQHTVTKHSEELDCQEGAKLHSASAAASQASRASSEEVCRLPEEGAASHLVRDRPSWKSKVESCQGTRTAQAVPTEYKGMKVRASEDEGFYACPVCGQSVPLDWTVEEHVDTLQPLLGLDAECSICHKKFTEHRALKQHMNFCKHKPQDEEVLHAVRPDGTSGAPWMSKGLDIFAAALPIALGSIAVFFLYRQFWRHR